MRRAERRKDDGVAQLARTRKRRIFRPMLGEYPGYDAASALARRDGKLSQSIGRGGDSGFAGAQLVLAPYDDGGDAGDREQSRVHQNDGDDQFGQSKPVTAAQHDGTLAAWGGRASSKRR